MLNLLMQKEFIIPAKTDLVSVDEHGQTSGWSPSKNPNPIEAQKLVEIILHEIRKDQAGRSGWRS